MLVECVHSIKAARTHPPTQAGGPAADHRQQSPDCALTDARAPATLRSQTGGCCRCESRRTPGTEGLNARAQTCVPAAPNRYMRRAARGWSTRAYGTRHYAHGTNVRSTRVRDLRGLPTRAQSMHALSTLAHSMVGCVTDPRRPTRGRALAGAPAPAAPRTRSPGWPLRL